MATLDGERRSRNWIGAFAHVDLVVIMPGPVTPGSSEIPCSAGAPFVVIPLLGRARYITTKFPVLVVAIVFLSAAIVLLLGVRLWSWIHAVEAPPSPGARPPPEEFELVAEPARVALAVQGDPAHGAAGPAAEPPRPPPAHGAAGPAAEPPRRPQPAQQPPGSDDGSGPGESSGGSPEESSRVLSSSGVDPGRLPRASSVTLRLRSTA